MTRRILTLTAAIAAITTSVYAGTVAYVAPAAPVIVEEPATMGGSGIWLIPLIAIALIALAMSNDSGGSIQGSDSRIKRDIEQVGTADNGLPLYEFRYILGSTKYLGVMAQDVLAHTPDAVVRSHLGYYKVNYDMLGLEMKTLH